MTFQQFLTSMGISIVEDNDGSWKAIRSSGKTLKRKTDGKMYSGYRSYMNCSNDLEDDLVRDGILTVKIEEQ